LVDVRTGARHADGRLGGCVEQTCFEEDTRSRNCNCFISA
jgi:hypothetical protein